MRALLDEGVRGGTTEELRASGYAAQATPSIATGYRAKSLRHAIAFGHLSARG
jgi:hypothetical protein